MAMRDEIKVAIEKGGATKDSLLELTGTTEKGLASQFTYMRMMGNCPMKQEDGTFKIVTGDEWEAHKAESGTAVTKNFTPAERVKRAEKRSARAASAFDNAKKRYEADKEDKLNELKFVKADAELQIAEIELGAVEKAKADAELDAEIEKENEEYEKHEKFDDSPDKEEDGLEEDGESLQ